MCDIHYLEMIKGKTFNSWRVYEFSALPQIKHLGKSRSMLTLAAITGYVLSAEFKIRSKRINQRRLAHSRLPRAQCSLSG